MPESIGRVIDRDGDRVDVEVDGADVFLAVHASTHCVVLDSAQQEEFAQYYVAACHLAAVNREADRVCAELDRAAMPGQTCEGGC